MSQEHKKASLTTLGSKAVVVVANRMLKVVWVMLVRREVYSGVHQRLYEEKLNRVGFDM
jgi:hypothetical protein